MGTVTANECEWQSARRFVCLALTLRKRDTLDADVVDAGASLARLLHMHQQCLRFEPDRML